MTGQHSCIHGSILKALASDSQPLNLSIILTAGKKRERRVGQDKQVIPPLVKLGDGQLPEEAQLNSTLALKVALEKVTLEEFDPQKAVEEKLRMSTHTKNQISAKAAEGTSLMLNPHSFTSSQVFSVYKCLTTFPQ